MAATLPFKVYNTVTVNDIGSYPEAVDRAQRLLAIAKARARFQEHHEQLTAKIRSCPEMLWF